MIDVIITKYFKHDGGFVVDWEVKEVTYTTDHKSILIEKDGIVAVLKDCGEGWWLKFRYTKDAPITDEQYSEMIKLLQVLQCKYDYFERKYYDYNFAEVRGNISVKENPIGDTTYIIPLLEYIMKGIMENEFKTY